MTAPSTAIRLNPFKGMAGPEGTPVPWSRYGRILSERPNFTLDPLFHAGCYYVQDSSAMYVGHVFGMHAEGESLRVLDLCAAPGGKTTDLATILRERCGDGFTLVANEVIKSRASVLRDNVGIWGDPNVVVTSVDPAVIGRELKGWFDVIVADVPCSGEGMFRKDPRAEKEWSPAVVDLCAARQKRILADVWPALRQGGLLVYSTCTYEEKENDYNLEWAASELGGEIIPPSGEFGEHGVRLTRWGNLLRAGEVPGEGQWAGALRKSAPAPSSRKPVIPGVLPAEETDRALAIGYKPECPVVELSLSDARKYLHRDTLCFPDEPKGLLIASYLSHPLGFMKNLGSRCNNLLPKNRRILMDV